MTASPAISDGEPASPVTTRIANISYAVKRQLLRRLQSLAPGIPCRRNGSSPSSTGRRGPPCARPWPSSWSKACCCACRARGRSWPSRRSRSFSTSSYSCRGWRSIRQAAPADQDSDTRSCARRRAALAGCWPTAGSSAPAYHRRAGLPGRRGAHVHGHLAPARPPVPRAAPEPGPLRVPRVRGAVLGLRGPAHRGGGDHRDRAGRPQGRRPLGVDVLGMPLLLLSRQAFDASAEPVEWAQFNTGATATSWSPGSAR